MSMSTSGASLLLLAAAVLAWQNDGSGCQKRLSAVCPGWQQNRSYCLSCGEKNLNKMKPNCTLDKITKKCKETWPTMAPVTMAPVPAPTAAPPRPSPRPGAPNIILMVGDDVGFNDIGYSATTHGERLLTPTLDALARDGIRLGAHYTYRWCAPSRSALLSGRYAMTNGFANGLTPNVSLPGSASSCEGLSTEYTLLPAVLRNAGYYSYGCGKWHLGESMSAFLPEQRGFDQWLGYLGGAEDYYSHNITGVCPDAEVTDLWLSNGTKSPGGAATQIRRGEYSANVYTRYVQDTIRDHVTSYGRDAPFFFYVAWQSVHAPLEVPRRYIDDLYGEEARAGNCSWDAYKQGSGWPCVAHDGGAQFRSSCFCNRVMIKAQMSALDEGVANITAVLDSLGVMNNTILVFLGDNGGPHFEAHSNIPFRGGKKTWWEGGVRPAAFLHSPLLPTGGLRGKWYNETVSQTDWFTTFANLAGGAMPSYAVDGIDAWPTLSSSSASPGAYRNETLIGEAVLRVGQYKLIASMDYMLTYCILGTGGGWIPLPSNATDVCPFGKAAGECDDKKQQLSDVDKWLCSNPCTADSPCLFDVVADPTEHFEISKQHPDIVESLKAKLAEYQAREFRAPFPVDNGRACQAAKDNDYFRTPWLDP